MPALLPCPFCGGEVVELKSNWNAAHAWCTCCNNEWGHCGAAYEGRFDKWNQRADTKEGANLQTHNTRKPKR